MTQIAFNLKSPLNHPSKHCLKGPFSAKFEEPQLTESKQNGKVIPLSRPSFSAKSGNLPPRKGKNADVRSREYLSPDEVENLIEAARRNGRNGHRDATLILLAYRHGLRVSEAIALRWDQIDLKSGLMHVRRVKNGVPSVHPLRGPEIRALRKLRRESLNSSYVFVSERKGPLTDRTVRNLVMKVGEKAGILFPVHPHMLRHSTGFYLANKGQDTRGIQAYLGHRNIQHTVRYTEVAANRFRNFWED